MNTLDQLRQARDEVDAAEKRLNEVCRTTLPVGHPVTWERPSGRVQDGYVLGHDHGDRIKVHNIYTDTEYWIAAYDILRAS